MSNAVLCLRPKSDFLQVGVEPPTTLSIRYAKPDDPALAALVCDANAMVIPAVGPPLPPALFAGSKVHFVQVTGAGVDRLDQAGMKDLGIAVANVPGGSNQALAEYVLTAALVLLRRFIWADAEIRAGRYAAFRARMLADHLPGLEGLTVGVVGLGAIGLAVARAFHRMGSVVVYHDPAPRDPTAAERLGARALDLPELLAVADIVTLHVPLLPTTKGLIGRAQFDRMKPDAVLINAARGGIVDEAELASAVAEARIGGAAVDVYATEPPDVSNPLLALCGAATHRVLFTPHIAGTTRQSWRDLFQSAWRNVEQVLLQGQPIHNRVY